MKSFVANAADETQVKKASSKVKSLREKQLNDVRFILSDVQGRRFLYRYLEEAGVFKSSFTGSSETFFNEGQRNIGLKLLADITEADVEAFVKMMAEAKKKEQEENV